MKKFSTLFGTLVVIVLCITQSSSRGTHSKHDSLRALMYDARKGQTEIDLSTGRPASQSSDYKLYKLVASASNGNDGNLNQAMTAKPDKLCAHTQKEVFQWWKVDLQRPCDITHIKLWSRGDCCADLLTPFQIQTSDNDKDWKTCNDVTTAGANGQIYDLPCVARARYVRVYHPKDEAQYLMVCEFQAWGTEYITTTTTTTTTPPPTTTPPVPTCTPETKADLIFVLDDSGSILETNFKNGLIPAVKEMLNWMMPGDPAKASNTHVAIIIYDSNVTVIFNLQDYQTKNQMLTAIDKIPYFGLGTATGDGLAAALQMLKQSGMARSGVKPIVVLITDGDQNLGKEQPVPMADALKALGVGVFGVGVGPKITTTTLDQCASGANYRRDVSNYMELKPEMVKIAAVACNSANSNG